MQVRHASFSAALGLVAAIILSAAPADAYRLRGFGGRLGFLDPEDLEDTAVFGFHLEFDERRNSLHLMPGVMVWSTDFVTDVNPCFDVYYHFSEARDAAPYVGGGLGVHFYDFDRFLRDDTDIGMNLFGGIRFPARSADFFLEGRYVATDISQTSVAFAVTFDTR